AAPATAASGGAGCSTNATAATDTTAAPAAEEEPVRKRAGGADSHTADTGATPRAAPPSRGPETGRPPRAPRGEPADPRNLGVSRRQARSAGHIEGDDQHQAGRRPQRGKPAPGFHAAVEYRAL